jgi:hypothetical protein
MNSIHYPEHTARKNILGPWAKAAVLLVISLGLLWFSMDFPAFLLFKPQSAGWVLWFSYAKDLIQPFALYFFICLGERWLKNWQWRALIAFAIPTLLEIGQGLYYQFSPSRYIGAFDPMDIVMYAMSVGLAALIEQTILAKVFKFWSE